MRQEVVSMKIEIPEIKFSNSFAEIYIKRNTRNIYRRQINNYNLPTMIILRVNLLDEVVGVALLLLLVVVILL